MKKALLTLLSLVAFGTLHAQNVEYTPEDSTLVVQLLSEAKTQRGDECRMMYFGKKFIGVPYVAHTLENGTDEHLIVNLHQLDCTTFVETVVALSLCDKQDARTFADYCRNLTLVRYRHGEMTDYTSRLHYFTWWGEDNAEMGIVSEVAPPRLAADGAFSALQTIGIDYMTKHSDSYKQLKLHPDFTPVIRDFEKASNGKKYLYVPKSNVGWSPRSSLGMVHSGDILAMLTDKPGLDTSHIGIAVWQKGKLHLLNASMIHKKVVLETKTLYQYQQSQKHQTGIRAFRFVE